MAIKIAPVCLSVSERRRDIAAGVSITEGDRSPRRIGRIYFARSRCQENPLSRVSILKRPDFPAPNPGYFRNPRSEADAGFYSYILLIRILLNNRKSR